ncbi:PX domain-containing protein [Entamoeba marina]
MSLSTDNSLHISNPPLDVTDDNSHMNSSIQNSSTPNDPLESVTQSQQALSRYEDFFTTDQPSQDEKGENDVSSHANDKELTPTDTNYQACEYIETSVTFEKIVDDPKGKYVQYKINTRTSHPEYAPGEHVVYRRYKQFESFRNKLKEFRDQDLKASTWGKIPKLPGDTFKSMYFINYRFKPEFTKERASQLDMFLESLLKHPSYLFNQETIKFLTEEDYMLFKPPTKIKIGN